MRWCRRVVLRGRPQARISRIVPGKFVRTRYLVADPIRQPATKRGSASQGRLVGSPRPTGCSRTGASANAGNCGSSIVFRHHQTSAHRRSRVVNEDRDSTRCLRAHRGSVQHPPAGTQRPATSATPSAKLSTTTPAVRRHNQPKQPVLKSDQVQIQTLETEAMARSENMETDNRGETLMAYVRASTTHILPEIGRL
jgi:hypothetical protein